MFLNLYEKQNLKMSNTGLGGNSIFLIELFSQIKFSVNLKIYILQMKSSLIVHNNNI